MRHRRRSFPVPVNQLIYDSLLLLQHRGQDAAGIATANGNNFHMHKANGMVRDVFRTRNMRSLPGNIGIGQVRYPTAGSASSEEEAQPFYVNAPFGIILAHNGNLTNWQQLKEEMFRIDRRHINTNSDTEVMLNVLAHELQLSSSSLQLDPAALFKAVSGVHRRVKGSYAIVSLIAGYGLVAFRDPFGIRPLCLGKQETPAGVEWMVASESVAIEGIGFEFVRDVAPGEAIFIDHDGNLHSQQCAENTSSKMQGFRLGFSAHCWLCRLPSLSMKMASPGSTSRTNSKPMPSTATDSDATIHSTPVAVSSCRARADGCRTGRGKRRARSPRSAKRSHTTPSPADARRDTALKSAAGSSCRPELDELQLVREHVEQHFGVRRGVDVPAVDAEHLVLQLQPVRQVAVVREDDAERRVHVERLGFFLARRGTGRRVTHLADADVARQAAHVARAEHVAHHAVGLVHVEIVAVRRGDAGGVLTRDAAGAAGCHRSTD